MPKKSDKRTPTEKATDRFSYLLSLNKSKMALECVASHFQRFPEESIAPFSIVLKHHVAFHTVEFVEQLLSASERGRSSAGQTSSPDNRSANEQGA